MLPKQPASQKALNMGDVLKIPEFRIICRLCDTLYNNPAMKNIIEELTP